MRCSMIVFLFIIFSSVKIFAQSPVIKSETIPDTILEKECDDKMFTRVEITASLKIPVESFQDTLSALLKAEKVIFVTEKVSYMFLLTTQNKIFNFNRLSGKLENEDRLRQVILNVSHLWNPAIQNGSAVCAYTRIEIINKDGKIQFRFFQ